MAISETETTYPLSSSDNSKVPKKRIDSNMASYIVCFTLSLLFLVLFGIDVFKSRKLEQDRLKAMEMPTNAKVLLVGRHDFLGDTNATYTLVEFGDYECPPCRAHQKTVLKLLATYKGKLKLDFRNLPLVSLHKYAMNAAIAAESARSKGRFWAVHDALFSSDLDSNSVKKILEHNNVTEEARSVAQAGVTTDTELANRLELNSTPTFLLCKPDGKVVHLDDLETVTKLIP